MATDVDGDMYPLSGKHIVVAGAGIAGLAFARAIDQYWPPEVPRPKITIYERDPRDLPLDRGNYSLGLRSDRMSGGLQALKKLGLLDDVFNVRTSGSTAGMTIRDANWYTIMKMKQASTPDGLPAAHMRITRNDLRECLVNGIADGADMHWGVACASASTSKDGKMEIVLSDESRVECDLLVVADGASSRIRGCLRPDDDLDYAGVVILGGTATFSEGNMPTEFREGFGPVLGGDGHALIVHTTDEQSVVWFITRRSSSPRAPVKGAEALKAKDDLIKEALNEGKVFAEPFPTLVAATEPSSLKIFNAQDKQPISHSQIPGVRYVFIGDSNHAVRYDIPE